jgi:hypothetical protein
VGGNESKLCRVLVSRLCCLEPSAIKELEHSNKLNITDFSVVLITHASKTESYGKYFFPHILIHEERIPVHSLLRHVMPIKVSE